MNLLNRYTLSTSHSWLNVLPVNIYKTWFLTIIMVLMPSFSLVNVQHMLGTFVDPVYADELDRDGIDDKDYSDGEFEGRMGWYPDRNASAEYYDGYSEGRNQERHEEIMHEMRMEWDEQDD